MKIAVKITMKPIRMEGVITSERKITPKIAAKMVSKEMISDA